MLKSVCGICVMAALAATATADAQGRLIAEKIKELDEINRQVIQQLGDLSKYDNQTVYVKARLAPLGDGAYKVKIEQISTDKIEPGNSANRQIIIVKGKVAQDKTKKFTLELENVLPPSGDKTKRQNVNDNSKSGEKKK